MRIDSFKIEEWMNRYCPAAEYNLTGTCIKPLSIRELLALCAIEKPFEIFDRKLDYGDIHGSERLKGAVLSLYERQKPENLTLTHGAIGANQLVYDALLEYGDEVISIVPAYQQHYSIPKSHGAKVTLLFLKEENRWQPDLREIENAITGRTKLICFTNPNNPTGAVIPDNSLEKIAEIAKNSNVWVLSDEVYRGLNLSGNLYSRAMADIYSKGISTGSMSKAYSLPGLRTGWVCAREDLINEINKHREYNTISISILDDYFSALALENKDKIEKRNFGIMREGLEILKEWLNDEIYIKAVLPEGGTTVFLRYKKDIASKTLCRNLLENTGTALLPGETMEMEGFVRAGFCMDAEILKTGLKLFSKYLRTI